MKTFVADCEANGLVPTKFHCFCYKEFPTGASGVLTSPDEIINFLSQKDLRLIMHNGIQWDIPQLSRVFNIKPSLTLIDSLPLSWYLNPSAKLHGLEAWGERFGIPKPPIVDWENEDVDVYIHRCVEDVKINFELAELQSQQLSNLYDTKENIFDLPIVKYLMFKMDCAREQSETKWKLDVQKCNENWEKLLAEKHAKEEALRQLMPKVAKLAVRTYPAKPYTKAGKLSANGEKWKKLAEENNLPFEHKDPIPVIVGYDEPNPSSPDQVKDCLFSLGWEPETFKEVVEDNGNIRKIPQVKKMNSPDLCDSVLRLKDNFPVVAELEGLSIINHRLGLLEGFMRNKDDENFLKAEISGFTNTLRYKHTTVVNLPGVDKLYGKEVRECLIARPGMIQCGSDMSALEDLTKRHYMFDYDPDYVNEMNEEGYDPHLDLAKINGVLSPEQVQAHKDGKENHSKVRKIYKVVNYSATYGVRKRRLSRDLKCTVAFAESLLDAYWKRNWSIKKIADNCIVKRNKEGMWLYNPVSKFWYSLRYEKDKFSTLNSSTGVYCFDRWLYETRKRGVKLIATFHDEQINELNPNDQEAHTRKLLDAIKATNDALKLNVELKIDIKYGRRYSDIH